MSGAVRISFVFFVALWLSVSLGFAQKPVIEVYTDTDSYEIGQELVLSVMGNNEGPGIYVDVHIAVVTPDGRIYEVPGWSTDFTPILPNVFLPTGFSYPKNDIGRYSVGSFPMSQSGEYLGAGALARPGTLDFVSEIYCARFEVRGGDGNDSPSDAIRLSMGDSYSGTLSPAGDVDWYKFDVGLLDNVTVDTTGDTDTLLYWYDNQDKAESDDYTASDDDSGDGHNARITHLCPWASTCYVKVCGRYADTTGDYTVRVYD